jgi:hypothetical protein
MKVKEIKDILDARGIAYEPTMLKAELEVLLPEDVVKDAPDTDLEATDSTVATKVDVYNKHGVYIRTYSLEQHGVDFDKLASQFQEKIDK